jgi:uncharacterized protein YceK
MRNSSAVVLFCFMLLSGCASVVEGRAQELTINTTPAGATCALARNETPLGTILSTPGTLYIEKTKDDISINCDKSGYQRTTYLDKSGYPEYNWAYILVGGPIGWGLDSVTGADNQYASPVNINLSKQ